MWNEPTKGQLSAIPPFYSNEKSNTTLKEVNIYVHFFFGGSDWYVAEFDGDDLFWGYTILNSDYQNAEWGYFSLRELKSIRINGMEIDRDLHWCVCEASVVEKIQKGGGF